MTRTMNPYGFSVTIIVCVLFTIISISSGIMIKGKHKKVNLMLYEGIGGKGNSMSYLDYIPWFDDTMSAVAEAGLSGISWMCVETGVFIFYLQTEFHVETPEQVRIFSGPRKCTTPSPLGMGSLRHSSTKLISAEDTPHLSIFSEFFYGGFMYTVIEKSERGIGRFLPIQSVMLVGPANWTVTTKQGITFCLTTFSESTKDVYVCLVPNTEEFFQIGPNGDDQLLYWKEVRKGCQPEVEKRLVNTCFDYYSGEVQEPAVSPKLPKPKIRTGGNPTVSATNSSSNDTNTLPPITSDCEDFTELAFLLKMRVTHDFQTNYQFLLPSDKMQSWRTELLDVTFEVASSILSTTNTTLPNKLLPQVREYLVYFLESRVWGKGKGFPEHKPSHELNVILHQTKTCLQTLETSEFFQLLQSKLRNLFSLPPENFTDSTQLQRNPELDLVMEFTYVIFNMVSVSCSQIQYFDTNYWLEYITMVDDMYLTPMIPLWSTPDIIAKFYPALFGGYGIEDRFLQLVKVTSSLYKMVEYMEIYPRPMQWQQMNNDTAV